MPEGRESRTVRHDWLIWVAAAGALALGWGAVDWNAGIVRDAMRHELLLLAESAAATIDPHSLDGISPTAIETEGLRRLRHHVYAFSRVGFEGVRFSVSFPDDSGFMVGTGDHLPMSRAASDWQSAEVKAVVATGRSRVVGPYSTPSGSFAGAFVPVKDLRSGETLMVVGAEVDADYRERASLRERPSLLWLALLAAGLLAAGALTLKWRDRQPADRQVRWRHLEAVAVALLGLTATAAAAVVVQDHETRSQDAAFLQLARERAIAIREVFREIRDLHLGGTARLFESSEDVSREEFRAFVNPIVRSGFVEAMNWVPVIPAALVPALESRARADGLADFQVFPKIIGSSAGGARYPLFYREPLAENTIALGFDLWSERTRRAVIEEVIATGLATASEPVSLIHETESLTGVLCLHPVFAPEGADRGAVPALRGFVVAVARMGPLIDRAPVFRGGEGEAVLTELYQLKVNAPPQRLASAGQGISEPRPHLDVRVGTVFPVFFLGKTYGVVLRPGPGFDATYPQRAGWLSVLAGLFVTAAASGFVGFATSRRQRLERRVRERTERLASIIRGTRAGTWEWDVATGRLEVNERWAEIAGYTLAELAPVTSATWQALCHPVDFERSDALLRAHIRGEIDYYDCECRLRHKTGHWVWIQDRGAVVSWRSDGGPALMTGTLTDITKRKEAEEAFQRSEEKLRLAMDATSDGLWDWNIQTGAVEWNGRCFTMLGYGPQEFTVTYDMWKSLVHPDDRPRVEADIRDQVAAGGQYVNEFRHRCKDGLYRWVLARGRVVERDGNDMPLRMVGTHTDITERKRVEEAFQRSEEKLRLAMEATSDGMWDWDVRTGVIDCDARCYTMMGFEPQEFCFTYDVWRSFVHPDDRERVLAELHKQMRSRGQLAIEYRYRRKDGDWLWILVRGRVVEVDAAGSAIRMVGTQTDIDRRRKAEDEALKARHEAEMANRAKSEFLANTSHELRTPLNSIIGFSSALASGIFGPIADPKHREYIADIESSGRHLLELINDVLDLSAIEAGKLDLREEEFAVPPACAAVIRLVKLRADHGRLSLTCSLPTHLPRLRADERRFKQVLLNLLTNAIKFTPAKGKVELSARIEPDGALSMIVSDTGIGMDEEGMRRAMMEFVRVDSSLSRKYEGAGLGLPLSRGLMERHGGTLHLSSAPGAGTVATATFPPARVLVGEESSSELV